MPLALPPMTRELFTPTNSSDDEPAASAEKTAAALVTFDTAENNE